MILVGKKRFSSFDIGLTFPWLKKGLKQILKEAEDQAGIDSEEGITQQIVAEGRLAEIL